MLSELPTACRLPGPAPKAVVPARFVVSVFHMTRPCRMAGAQCVLPLAFGVCSAFSCSFLLLLFSGVLPCSRLCVGGLWSVVLCFQLTRARPLCFLAAFSLPRVRPCAEDSRARQIRCYCFSHDQAVSPAWCAVLASLGLWRLFCLFLLPSSPSLLVCAPCSCLCVGGLWSVVLCF